MVTFTMRSTFAVKYCRFFILKMRDCFFTNLAYDCSHLLFPLSFFHTVILNSLHVLYIIGLLHVPCDCIRNETHISHKVLLFFPLQSMRLYFHKFDIQLFPFFFPPKLMVLKTFLAAKFIYYWAFVCSL